MAPDGVSRAKPRVSGRSNEAEQVRQETRRIYDASQWVGPLGQAALGPIVVWQLWGKISTLVLVGWVLVLALAAVALTGTLLLPAFSKYQSSDGLPLLVAPCHLVFGFCYGGLLWLDPALVSQAELRWLCLTVMFAASAGVSTGLAGLHGLALRVLVPTWTLGPLALLVWGQPILAAGTALFLVIVTVDHRRTGELWRELVALRVDQEHRAEENQWAAEHDNLTGLLNRSGVFAGLGTLDSRPVTVMYIDLDFFKAVNDRLGHTAGDAVLAEVGRRLSGQVREEDLVGRFGGDEFFVVFARHIPPVRAKQLGMALIDAIEQPILTDDGTAQVSASIGVASGMFESDATDVMINRADRALIQAKRAGRRQVLVHASPSGTPDL